MTNYNQETQAATSLYHPLTNTPYESSERTKLYQNSMVAMWQTMAKLFHPQWTKNNGEIGSQVFRDWTIELERFGPDGVLRGIESVRMSGNSYAPNLNKFIGHCADNYSQPVGQYGGWQPCPYTGMRRRLKPGQELLAAGFETDPRSHEQIRQDIERKFAAGEL